MPLDYNARNRVIIMRFLDAATELLQARRKLKGLREAIESHGMENVLTTDVFDGANSQVQPSDFVPFLAAMDALEAMLVDPETGLPTDHLKAIMKFQRADSA